MRNIFTIVLIVCCCLSHAYAQPSGEANVHNLTLQGIDRLYNLEMEQAERSFDEVIRLAPNDPRGYFFKAMIYFWTFTLNKNKQAYEQFFELSDKVIELCENELDKDEKNALATFYLGGIYGYRGIAYQRDGSLLKAAWNGRKGYSYLKDATTLKPDLYDAQMGFGLFSYLVGKVPKSYRWLLNIIGFSGDIEGGLVALRQAAEQGTYTRSEASFYLAEFLYFEDRREEAYIYINRVMEKHPENTLFLSQYAQWEYRQEKLETAMAAAQKAIAINNKKNIKIGDEFAHSILANCYFVKNEYKNAIEHGELYMQKVENKELIPVSIYYRLGVSYEILGDRTKAVTYYRQIRASQSGTGGGGWQQQYIRRGQQRLQQPLTEVDIVLIKAENAASLNDFKSAVKLYKEALGKRPDTDQLATALYGMAQAYHRQEKYKEAIETALELVALQPPREMWLVPHGYYVLGRAYAQLGQVNDARAAFEMIGSYKNYDSQSRLESRVEQELQKLAAVN